jgi:hypothetical protein
VNLPRPELSGLLVAGLLNNLIKDWVIPVMSSRKGQTSVELIMVVGMMLVLSSPFILSSQTSVIQLRDASRFLDLDRSMEETRQTSLELNHSSYPARRVINFQSPAGVEEVYNPVFSDGSALIFQINARGESINRSVILDLRLNLTDPSALEEEGIHDVSLRRADDKINMSVIS